MVVIVAFQPTTPHVAVFPSDTHVGKFGNIYKPGKLGMTSTCIFVKEGTLGPWKHDFQLALAFPHSPKDLHARVPPFACPPKSGVLGTASALVRSGC